MKSLNTFLNESTTNGYWILPSGKVIDISSSGSTRNELVHNEVVKTNPVWFNLTPKTIEKGGNAPWYNAVKNGGIRIRRFAGNTHWTVSVYNWEKNTKKKLQKWAKTNKAASNKNEVFIYEELTNNKPVKYTIKELVQGAHLFEDVLNEYKAAGFWILKSGKILNISNTGDEGWEEHYNIIRKKYKDFGLRQFEIDSYDTSDWDGLLALVIQDGAIRIRQYEETWTIVTNVFNSNTKKRIQKWAKTIKKLGQYDTAEIYVTSKNSGVKAWKGEKKVAEYTIKELQQGAHLFESSLNERWEGYWLDPMGKEYKLPTTSTHGDFIDFNPHLFFLPSDYSAKEDNKWFTNAQKKGWTRIRNMYSHKWEVNLPDRSKKYKKHVKDWATKQILKSTSHDKDRVSIYVDRYEKKMGEYTLKEIADDILLFESIQSKTLNTFLDETSLFSSNMFSQDIGWIVLKTGKIIEIGRNITHEDYINAHPKDFGFTTIEGDDRNLKDIRTGKILRKDSWQGENGTWEQALKNGTTNIRKHSKHFMVSIDNFNNHIKRNIQIFAKKYQKKYPKFVFKIGNDLKGLISTQSIENIAKGGLVFEDMNEIKASLDLDFGMFQEGYWMDKNGKIYKLENGEYHGEFMERNQDLFKTIKNKYDFRGAAKGGWTRFRKVNNKWEIGAPFWNSQNKKNIQNWAKKISPHRNIVVVYDNRTEEFKKRGQYTIKELAQGAHLFEEKTLNTFLDEASFVFTDSSNFQEGYWLTKKGKLIQLPKGKYHADFEFLLDNAKELRIANQLKYSFENAFRLLAERGNTRLRKHHGNKWEVGIPYFNSEYKKIVQNWAKKVYNKNDIVKIYRELPSLQYVGEYTIDTIIKGILMFEDINESNWSTGGYILSPQGKIIKLGNHDTHPNYIMNHPASVGISKIEFAKIKEIIRKENNIIGNNIYLQDELWTKGRENGYIYIRGYREVFDISTKYYTNQQKRVLQKWARTVERKSQDTNCEIYVSSSNKSYSRYNVKELTQGAHLFEEKSNERGKEFSNGWWISPRGKIISIGKTYHVNYIIDNLKTFKKTQKDIYDGNQTLYNSAIENGWIAIRGAYSTSNIINVNMNRMYYNNTRKKYLQKWAKTQKNKKNFMEIGDEGSTFGVYPVKEVEDGMLLFENELNEGEYTKGLVGWWITHKGKIIDVANLEHYEQILKNPIPFGLTRKDISSNINMYDKDTGLANWEILLNKAIKKGNIRIRGFNFKNISVVTQTLNKNTKERLQKWAKEIENNYSGSTVKLFVSKKGIFDGGHMHSVHTIKDIAKGSLLFEEKKTLNSFMRESK